MKHLLDKYIPVYAKDTDGNEITETLQDDKPWETLITSLEAKLTEVSQKLADVEGRANPNQAEITELRTKLSSLETKLTAAETELAEAKQRREAKKSKPQSVRKAQLAQKNQSSSGEDESPDQVTRKRERRAWL